MKLDPNAFVGKTVFVGIDVHKKTYSVVAVCEGVVVLKVGSMPAQAAGLVALLKERFAGAHVKSAYEAGFSGFGLHRELVEGGIASIVVDAASIEVAANDRVKTDKRDAAKIALQLSRGALRGIYVPTPEEDLKRQINRTRQQLIKQRTRTSNQIKSRLLYFGLLAADDDRVVTRRYLDSLAKTSLPDELRVSLAALTAVWKTIDDEIDVMDQELRRQAAAEPNVALLKTAPGVGPLISVTVANELGDLRRFPSVKHLYSYLGLTPSEWSSGPSERRGHITRQGPGYLRGLFVEAAWIAKEKDPELGALYERLKVHRGGKRAIVAVARNLAGRLRACVLTQTRYDREHHARKAMTS